MKSRAFTLAEVLITLAIIGIVAAITIPVLLKNIQDIQFKTAYRKAYSTLSQAVSHANADSALDSVSSTFDPAIIKNFKTIMSYVKTQKICYSGNDVSGCWNLDGEAFNSSSNKNGLPHAGYSDYAAIDAAGMSWNTYGQCFVTDILVDTNGFKGPNQFGKDRFYFHVLSENNSSANGVPVKVLPDSDNDYYACLYNKCSSENNYYATSWIVGTK